MNAKQNYSILLIEDNAAQVQLFEEALKEGPESVTLQVVSDGEFVLTFLRTAAVKPDLIILDLHLPKKSGNAVLREIKSEPEFKLIPVIILTSSSREDDIETAYQGNASCYIKKPLTFEDFVDVIKSIEKVWLTYGKLPSRPVKSTPII